MRQPEESGAETRILWSQGLSVRLSELPPLLVSISAISECWYEELGEGG